MASEHFTKENLIQLLSQSKAVSMMNQEEMAALVTMVATADRADLIKLYVLLKSEKASIDELENEFDIKCMKTLDAYTAQVKGEVQRLKKEEVKKSEKKVRSKEEKLEDQLLSDLSRM